MPTMNPRITFTVSDDTMKAIDEYRFEHRMRNQTQAILSLIDLGFKVLSGDEPAQEPKFTDEEMRVVAAYRAADDGAKHYALQMLESNPRQKGKNLA